MVVLQKGCLLVNIQGNNNMEKGRRRPKSLPPLRTLKNDCSENLIEYNSEKMGAHVHGVRNTDSFDDKKMMPSSTKLSVCSLSKDEPQDDSSAAKNSLSVQVVNKKLHDSRDRTPSCFTVPVNQHEKLPTKVSGSALRPSKTIPQLKHNSVATPQTNILTLPLHKAKGLLELAIKKLQSATVLDYEKACFMEDIVTITAFTGNKYPHCKEFSDLVAATDYLEWLRALWRHLQNDQDVYHNASLLAFFKKAKAVLWNSSDKSEKLCR